MIGKVSRLFRGVSRSIAAVRELVHELRAFRSTLEAERAATKELWALKDEARCHYHTVALPAYRVELEAAIRANPNIKLDELARRFPGPSPQFCVH